VPPHVFSLLSFRYEIVLVLKPLVYRAALVLLLSEQLYLFLEVFVLFFTFKVISVILNLNNNLFLNGHTLPEHALHTLPLLLKLFLCYLRGRRLGSLLVHSRTVIGRIQSILRIGGTVVH
jgi:hypothetical protein